MVTFPRVIVPQRAYIGIGERPLVPGIEHERMVKTTQIHLETVKKKTLVFHGIFLNWFLQKDPKILYRITFWFPSTYPLEKSRRSQIHPFLERQKSSFSSSPFHSPPRKNQRAAAHNSYYPGRSQYFLTTRIIPGLALGKKTADASEIWRIIPSKCLRRFVFSPAFAGLY